MMVNAKIQYKKKETQLISNKQYNYAECQKRSNY
jgi:hypothetical protein